jgi:hypothetical protein
MDAKRVFFEGIQNATVLLLSLAQILEGVSISLMAFWLKL